MADSITFFPLFISRIRMRYYGISLVFRFIKMTASNNFENIFQNALQRFSFQSQIHSVRSVRSVFILFLFCVIQFSFSLVQKRFNIRSAPFSSLIVASMLLGASVAWMYIQRASECTFKKCLNVRSEISSLNSLK